MYFFLKVKKKKKIRSCKMLSISLFLNKVVQDINLHMLWNYFVSLKGIPQEALFYMLYEGKTHLIMKFYFLL